MGRPSDWWVLDLDADPTPGDPLRVRELARSFSELSADAFDAAADVRRLSGDSGVAGWVGEAGAVFGEAIGEFPGQLDKLDTSYGMAGRALTTYAGDLETAQSQADAALVRGREAHGRLRSAQGQAAGAETDEQTARTALSTASGVWPLTDVPASWASAPPPGVDPEQVRLHTDAAGRLSGLRTQVSDAQSDVDAERALAVAAKTLRETAASTCKGEIDRASDAGIHNRSFWDKARDFVSDAWDVLVKLANVVIVVAAIAALILGGPILWTLVVVAAAVVLADTLMNYANGEASLWDVGFALLNFVPGGKALSLGAGLARGASRLRALGGALRGGWGTVRNMAGGLRGGARTMASRVFGRDPVDVVTGQVTLTQTDVELPGLLPLVLERTHHSTYRHGRHFGTTWASTLDQRLELDTEGACLPLADGTILTYPTPPNDGTPVLPAEGVRWPLAVDPNTGDYNVTDPQTGRTLHFPAVTAEPDLAAGGIDVCPIGTITDRNGHRIDVDRASDGTPTAVRHSGGYEVAIDTNIAGEVTAFRLVSGDDEPMTLTRFGYDTLGDLSTVIGSSGHPQRFGYDAQGRLTGWTDRNDSWYSYAYDEAGRCVRTTGSDGFLSGAFAYDPQTRTNVATDSLGHQRTFVYNALDQVVAETDPLGNTTTSQWGRYDWLLSRTDPLRRKSSYRYDNAGNIVEVVRPDGAVANAAYDRHSRPTFVVDIDGTRWERTYDQHGNLTSATDPLGATTTYRYDADRPGHLVSITDALGRTTHVETNLAGLLTRLTSPSGAATEVEYRSDGRVHQVADPVGGTSRYAWTVEGKLAYRAAPDGAVERWRYDGEGNLVEHVDAAGFTTLLEYTHFDLASARIGPDGSRITFGYDTELRLVSVTNPQGMVWRYSYDAAGQLTSETDFDGRTVRYEYDAAGQLVARTNGAGQTIEFLRTALGKIGAKRTPAGVTSFEFDRAGRTIRAVNQHADCRFVFDALGQVIEESMNGRSVFSRYDAAGQRTRRVTPSGADSRWEWTTDGLPAALRTAGRTITFRYDRAGRETTRALDSGATLSHAWDSAGRLSAQTISATQPPTSPWDSLPTQQTDVVQHRSYAYSADGYLTSIDDLRFGRRHYGLDATRRVTAVSGQNWSESYAYDQAGNISNATWQATVATGPHQGIDDHDIQGDREFSGTRIQRAGKVRFEYDAQGRVTLRRQKRLSAPPRTWRYSWDADDRLTGVVTPDGQHWRYFYDPFGRRIAKQCEAFDGSVVERIDFAWDGLVLAEQIQTVGEKSGYVRAWDWKPGGFQPLAQIEYHASRFSGEGNVPRMPGPDAADKDQEWFDARFYAIVTDLVGSPTELLTENGTISWHNHATLWGVSKAPTHGEATCPLRFPGQYYDSETGANYNYFRYYDPTLGRFNSTDPLGLGPGPNPRGYVDNPTRWLDPLGLAPCIQDLYQSAVRPLRARGGDTAASRAYQKHMGRPGTTLIPLNSGRDRIDMSRYLIEDLLTNPRTAVQTWTHPVHGDVIDHILPDIGARWRDTGDFIGFLD